MRNKIEITQDGLALFHCSGCNGTHGVMIKDGHPNRWGFNGNLQAPTFTPSVLVRATKMTLKGNAEYAAWQAAGYPKPAPESFDSIQTVCHSFVTDGRIQYLSDCTHELAGQTIDLSDWSE